MKLFTVTGVNIEKLKLSHVGLDDMGLNVSLADSFHLPPGWERSWICNHTCPLPVLEPNSSVPKLL